jgi:hypothetical protein
MVALMWIGVKSLIRYILLVFVASSTLFISQINEAMDFLELFIFYVLSSHLLYKYIQIYSQISPILNMNSLVQQGKGEKIKIFN